MLSERFCGHVARVARSYGLNAHQVDDVTQETWLRLYRHIGSETPGIELQVLRDGDAIDIGECVRALLELDRFEDAR